MVANMIKYGILKKDLELIKQAHSEEVFEKDAELEAQLKKRNPLLKEESYERTSKPIKKS